MKTYRAKFNPNSKNVYSVSLVESPAMEGDFIQFSKENEIKFAEVDRDKRRIMGLILEPDKLIYRNQGGEQFNIMFTAQDIEDVAYNFQKQKNQTNSTLEHDGNLIDGVTFVETWLVENPEIDKSTNFGFNYPKGSWMGVMQLDNNEVWENYVQTGKVKGFSIDAFMQLEEINLNNVNMSEIKEENLLNKIVDAISLGFEKVGFKKAEKVDEEVKLENHEEKEKEETKLEDETVNEEAENLTKLMEQLLAKLTELMQPVSDEVVAMKKQIEVVKDENLALKKEVEEMSKQPATKIIKPAQQVDFSKMSAYEKFRTKLNK